MQFVINAAAARVAGSLLLNYAPTRAGEFAHSICSCSVLRWCHLDLRDTLHVLVDVRDKLRDREGECELVELRVVVRVFNGDRVEDVVPEQVLD